MKRALDVFGSGVGLILLAPFFLLVAGLIKLSDGGPVFFGQWRVGRRDEHFRMWKFRSMVMGADRLGPAITVGRDPRITRLGHRLRQTKLDELPQLWNVFRGHISLVGPRPEVPAYVALYTAAERQVLDLKPGITDPASFVFYDEAERLSRAADPESYYRNYLVPEKIRINLEYAARANIVTDLFLILATIAKMGKISVDVLKVLKLTPPGDDK